MPEHEVIPAFPESELPHVGTYRRVLPVSLERMYENTLDWEHLPYVHASSFSCLELLDSGSWGWRAKVVSGGGHESVIELRLDRACRRWITRTLAGRNQGAEIWTHAFPISVPAPISLPEAAAAERVDIVVDFFVPGIAREARQKVGRAYAALYTQLYDEDVAMMVERQRQLDRRVERAREQRELTVGCRSELALPLNCEVAGRQYVLAEQDDELLVYPALCPHQLGPLAGAPLEQGSVTCPWHGYRFDVRTGECLTGQSCRLAATPRIEERDGQIVLVAEY